MQVIDMKKRDKVKRVLLEIIYLFDRRVDGSFIKVVLYALEVVFKESTSTLDNEL